jgi:hypothetical protein
MQVFELGENSHTKEFLLYYFPDFKILIVGDLFYVGNSGVRASVRANELYSFIKKKGLKVEKLYSTWQPSGKAYATFDELKESARLYRER